MDTTTATAPATIPVESYYDRPSRVWVAYRVDEHGCQMADSVDAHKRADAVLFASFEDYDPDRCVAAFGDPDQ